MKKIDKQTFWAGMVGIVALIAIICELIFDGISTASVSAAIKDFMGIAIDVMVFIVAVKLATKTNSTDSLEIKLENALDKWRMDHANMIIRDNVTIDKIQPAKDAATMIVIANGLIADEENNITLDDQIQNLISIIDTAYTCYLVAGNFKESKNENTHP